MGQIISEKFKGKEFSRRIITTDVIIAGTIAGGGMLFLGIIGLGIGTLSFAFTLLAEYHKERKTITKLEVENDGYLRMNLTDFNSAKQFVIKLDDLDVTLKRSYRKIGSHLSIDFWITDGKTKRKILRQHCNSAWTSRDVKEAFLQIKRFKNSKLTARERNILNDYEFS